MDTEQPFERAESQIAVSCIERLRRYRHHVPLSGDSEYVQSLHGHRVHPAARSPRPMVDRRGDGALGSRAIGLGSVRIRARPLPCGGRQSGRAKTAGNRAPAGPPTACLPPRPVPSTDRARAGTRRRLPGLKAEIGPAPSKRSSSRSGSDLAIRQRVSQLDVPTADGRRIVNPAAGSCVSPRDNGQVLHCHIRAVEGVFGQNGTVQRRGQRNQSTLHKDG